MIEAMIRVIKTNELFKFFVEMHCVYLKVSHRQVYVVTAGQWTACSVLLLAT